MQLRAAHPYASRRSAVLAGNMVATSQPLAAQAGLSMIARGGNAADAAIATAIMLTLVEPSGNGVGSDAFAIIWDGTELHGLNASGRAPMGWTPERFAGLDAMPARGWESVTVPGAVSAWVEISERFGDLPFADLFEPAIRYAEEGFSVTPIIAQLWARGGRFLGDQPGFAETFLLEGRAPLAGERFRNPALARTFRRIAETRGRAFYEGDLAEAIVAHSKAHGGAMTLEDLASHKPDWCGTISKDFDHMTLHEIPPNCQGIAETYVADPVHMGAVSAADMLDDGYLASRARLIDPARATDFGAGAPKQGGTVYLSTADASGMMVSYIQSNYAGFGSGVAVPGTGIHLQNRGWGFSLDPQSPNLVGPGKRPFHTIIPGFLMKNGAPLMSFGVMGGPMQAQGHLQMLLRTQLWDQEVQMAADAPRWQVTQGLGVACEAAMGRETLAALAAMGHQIDADAPEAAFAFGGAQLIHRLPGGGYAGGSDPRKDGAAVGF
jgi:gamma-glutamyltranspeptidase/glutathione hydrolase